ncbi:MAG: glycosyltransferase family 4 protein, partial [bacterium]
LLKAMKQVRSSRLVLVGEGPERPKLEEFISQNQIPNVTFTGYKQGDELRAILAKAKFVVMPSEWYENAPFVIYESFAMGKPVIGSDLGGIPELIEHGKTGLIFKARNVEMLAAKINFLLDSDHRILAYGKRARQKAEKQFSPDIHYKKIMEKYNRMLKKEKK